MTTMTTPNKIKTVYITQASGPDYYCALDKKKMTVDLTNMKLIKVEDSEEITNTYSLSGNNRPSSIAHLVLDKIENDVFTIRCKTLQLSKGELAERHPYNPLNDRYLDINVKDKTLRLYKKGKRKVTELEFFDMQKMAESKSSCWNPGFNHKINFNSFIDLMYELLLKRFTSYLIVDDDFFTPINDYCESHVQYQYMLEMVHDETIINSATSRYSNSNIYRYSKNTNFNEADIKKKDGTLNCLRNGFAFNTTYYNGVRQMHASFPDYCSVILDEYGISTYAQLQQISGVFFILLNPGVESIYKSTFKSTLFDRITSGEILMSSKIADCNNTDKSGQKFLTYLQQNFHEKCIGLNTNNETALQNDISAYITSTIYHNTECINNFMNRVKGLNNAKYIADKFFGDYWYFLYMIATDSHIFNYQHRGLVPLADAEEARYKKNCKNTISSCLKDIAKISGFLNEHDDYCRDITHFVDYIFDNCRKQGFTSIMSFLDYLSDYIRMQTKQKAKYQKYPKDLMLVHNIANINLLFFEKTANSTYSSKAFTEAVECYKNLEYKEREYAMLAPTGFSELFTEGASLNHCVANYIQRVLDKKCQILFLRETKDSTTPFYTVCIENKEYVTQIKGLNQCNIDTVDLKDFVTRWAQRNKLTICSDVLVDVR